MHHLRVWETTVMTPPGTVWNHTVINQEIMPEICLKISTESMEDMTEPVAPAQHFVALTSPNYMWTPLCPPRPAGIMPRYFSWQSTNEHKWAQMSSDISLPDHFLWYEATAANHLFELLPSSRCYRAILRPQLAGLGLASSLRLFRSSSPFLLLSSLFCRSDCRLIVCHTALPGHVPMYFIGL